MSILVEAMRPENYIRSQRAGELVGLFLIDIDDGKCSCNYFKGDLNKSL